LYRTLFPALRVALNADMQIDAASASRSREKTLAALDRLEAELRPSGYLVGDRFSVADLTAAALLAPVVFPPEFPYPPPVPPPPPPPGPRPPPRPRAGAPPWRAGGPAAGSRRCTGATAACRRRLRRRSTITG